MFFVLFFTKENVVESVPKTWVEQKDGKTFCLWPKKLPGDKISKLIKNQSTPSQTWDLCPCTIKYECDSYEESRTKCQEAAYQTLTEASCDEEKDPQAFSDSSISSKSLPPSPRKKKFKKSSKHVHTEASTSRFYNTISPENDISKQYEELDKKLTALTKKMEYNTKICLESFTKLHKEILDCKEEIKVMKQSFQTKKSVPSKNLFPLLPLCSLEDLSTFEEDLKDDTMAQNLIFYLSSFGSSQMRTSVHQIMKRVLQNEVAVQYSLHGKGDKKKFIDLQLCTCVRGTVQYYNYLF